jgi:alpha/beta superfamily hydrolase
MAPPVDLPPPPERPELPPEVKIAGEQELLFSTEDGVNIQGLARLPATAGRAVVLCHPHPLYGGTMHNAVVVVVAKALYELGADRVGTLRFNYRGVGKSTGRYDAGVAEVFDARAAVAEVRRQSPRARISLLGYSFGTGVAYRAAVNEEDIDRISLVAPSPRMTKIDLGTYEGPVQIVAAGRDQFCSPEETEALAKRLRAVLSVVPEAEHYFIRFRREVARLVVPFVAPELSS